MPPSLPLQEVHVSKETIGKISVASKSKPMFFSTLQTLPLQPLRNGPKGNLLASHIFFPSPVFFHTVARVIFPRVLTKFLSWVKNLGRSLLLNFLARASRFFCCMTTVYPTSLTGCYISSSFSLLGIPSTCSSLPSCLQGLSAHLPSLSEIPLAYCYWVVPSHWCFS